jgi:hypothetical protein
MTSEEFKQTAFGREVSAAISELVTKGDYVRHAALYVDILQCRDRTTLQQTDPELSIALFDARATFTGEHSTVAEMDAWLTLIWATFQ